MRPPSTSFFVTSTDPWSSVRAADRISLAFPLLERSNCPILIPSLAGTGLSFFLSAAIRATNSMDGVVWCSTHNSVPFAVQHISVPILITGMQGNYFMRDDEIHYELAASAQGFHRD